MAKLVSPETVATRMFTAGIKPMESVNRVGERILGYGRLDSSGWQFPLLLANSVTNAERVKRDSYA